MALCDAGEARNLVVDASFESPLPSWFAERQGTSYYAGKEKVLGAAEGRTVLVIEGWDLQGSRVLSPPIALGTDPAGKQSLSATVAVRGFGKANVATFELALVDEKGTKPLASFGRLTLDGPRLRRQFDRIGESEGIAHARLVRRMHEQTSLFHRPAGCRSPVHDGPGQLIERLLLGLAQPLTRLQAIGKGRQ